MDLETKTDNKTEKLEESAKNFLSLVKNRNYKEAREYFKNLTSEKQKYIERSKNYSWALKTLSFSSM
ncbi:MAG: hypothetical protein AABW90_00305 [Nanoarchaeota archaeon]